MIQIPIKYILRSIILSSTLLCICFFAGKNLFGNDIESNGNVTDYQVETLSKEPVKLSSLLTDDCNIVVFYSNYTCKDCYKSIAKSAETLKASNFKINLLVLVRSPLSNKTRKEMYKEAKTILGTDKIYFDIHSKEDEWPPNVYEEGLFSLFPIKQTPALLYIPNPGLKANFFSYDRLIEKNYDLRSLLEHSSSEK